MPAPAPADSTPLQQLPLVTLYATDRCNSRCISCDYWRHGKLDLSLDSVDALLPDLLSLGTRVVLLSGGEPLLNPDWAAITRRLRAANLRVWLLTSGLSLAKNAERAAELFDDVTVSLDGTDRGTYQAIRGLDAFDKVCEGVRALAGHGLAPGIRVTVQRGNFRQLSAFVDLAKELGARSVSFLTIDAASTQAFGRGGALPEGHSLSAEDLPLFEEVLFRLEHDHREDFRSNFIRESPGKLRRQLSFFRAVVGRDEYPPVRCNAPEFSAVIGADGRVQPCFFIAAPPDEVAVTAQASAETGLVRRLDSPGMRELRGAIRRGERIECRTCVCSMWRDAAELEATLSGMG